MDYQFNINFGRAYDPVPQRDMSRELEKKPRVVVCDDTIRKFMGYRFHQPAESQVYAIKYGMIRTLVLDDYEVLVDDTHTSTTSIMRLLEIEPNADFLFVNTPPQTCIARAALTNQRDLKQVIERHWKNLCGMIYAAKEVPISQGFPDIDESIDNILAYVDWLRNHVEQSPEFRKTV